MRAYTFIAATILAVACSENHEDTASLPTQDDGGGAGGEPVVTAAGVGGVDDEGGAGGGDTVVVEAPGGAGGAAAGAGGEPSVTAGAGGAAGEAGAGGEAALTPVARVWLIGEDVAIGPTTGAPPAETPLAAVPMWIRTDDLNYNIFTPLQQQSSGGHGSELQAGVDLWKAGVPNIQIKIALKGAHALDWSSTGKSYSILKEETKQILAACPPGEYTDHIVINLGQAEAVYQFPSDALSVGTAIGEVRKGLEDLLGHAVASTHIEITQLSLPGAMWINEVRAAERSVPYASFVDYDDVQTGSPVGQNTLGSRLAASVLDAL